MILLSIESRQSEEHVSGESSPSSLNALVRDVKYKSLVNKKRQEVLQNNRIGRDLPNAKLQKLTSVMVDVSN